jgi:hypothetical protein
VRRAHAIRPLILPVLLAAAGVAAGGVPGFLLAFTAALLAVDRGLDRAAGKPVGADDAFARLARERRHAERRGGPASRLDYLPDDRGWAATSQRRRLGVQTIAVDSIIGTADSHKAATFDRDFRPPSWSRGRWTQMWLASRRGTELPPISVYRVGERHFVRDGHHRVSVGRALGATGIEAHVVELQPAVGDLSGRRRD